MNLYQNGILRVYSPSKGRDWSVRLDKIAESIKRIDNVLIPFVVVGLLIVTFIKLYG